MAGSPEHQSAHDDSPLIDRYEARAWLQARHEAADFDAKDSEPCRAVVLTLLEAIGILGSPAPALDYLHVQGMTLLALGPRNRRVAPTASSR